MRKIETKNIYDKKQLIIFTIKLLYDFYLFNFKNEQFFNFNSIKEQLYLILMKIMNYLNQKKYKV